MANFLFWNLNKKNLQTELASLVHKYDIDILMLAECKCSTASILIALNQNSTQGIYDYAGNSQCQRIQIFLKCSSDFIAPLYETDKVTIQRLAIPGLEEILLAVCHLSSKWHTREADQLTECILLSQDIKNIESQVGHSKTVVIGDLNINPFENGLVCASALHGVMSKQIAKEKTRTIQGKIYEYFYNPMWNLFGDVVNGPPGTYYYRKSNQDLFFWNMFDQVLIRPSLLDRFVDKSLKIITGDDRYSYLSNKGTPNQKQFSDHFPILFEMNL